MAKDPLTGEIVQWNESPQRWIDGSVDNDLPMTRLSEMFNVNHFIVSQVNPHVIPFIPQEGPCYFAGIGGQQASDSTWLHTLTGLAREEALHRLNVLSEMGMFPNTLRKLVSIMSQKYSGDINILPQITYEVFPSILKNPTPDFIFQACLCGERATWPKLGRIRNHCAIELALDAAVQTMRARVAFSPSYIDRPINTVHLKWGDGVEANKPIRAGRRCSQGNESERMKSDRNRVARRPDDQLRKTHSSLTGWEAMRF